MRRPETKQPDGIGEDASAARHAAVPDGDVMRQVPRLAGEALDPLARRIRIVRRQVGVALVGRTQLDAPAAEIAHQRLLDAAVPRARAEAERIAAQLRHHAADETDALRPHELDGGRHLVGGLGDEAALRRDGMSVEPEDQVAEDDIRDVAPRLAPHEQQPFGDRRLDDRRLGTFARERTIGKDARRTVQIPLPGLAEHLLDVLDPEARLPVRRMRRDVVARRGEENRPRRRVNRLDVLAGRVPLLEVEELEVLAVRPVRRP